jgi:prepilin-type N-terminal cleavage/methylation domain-containing protein
MHLSRRCSSSFARRSRGFTLVELMVTITIISVLVAILVPTVAKVKRRSVATSMANDLRVFAGAFDGYSHEAGKWPAEVDAGVLPPEMNSRLYQTAWQRPTRIGGHFNWDADQMHQGTRYRAVIAISGTSDSPLVQDADMWENIDRVIDDGNLSTGSFRLGADDEPIFIVAQ